MERPDEAFCIFNNIFSSTFSHLTKIKKQRAGEKFYNLTYSSSPKCHSPRPKLSSWREGMGRDVPVAAPGRLGTTVFSRGLSWSSSSSSRFFFLFFSPFQSHSRLLTTGGGCLLYLVASSARLWLGFVFMPFIIFPFQSRAILTYFFSLVIFKHLYPWGRLEQTG